jgi:hypothetical protein
MNPLQVLHRVPLQRELPDCSAFFDMSLKFLSKSSPNKNKFHHSLEGPRKGAPGHVPQNRDPMDTDTHF